MNECIFYAETQLLADYMRWIFPPEEKGREDAPCLVSSTHPTGKLLLALVERTIFPPRSPRTETDLIPVRISFPGGGYARAFHLHDKTVDGYLAYSPDSVSRINLALRAEFDMEFAGYYRRGEQMGMQKRDIIDAFIFSRGLAPESWDALHKRVYRSEIRSLDRIRKQLLRRAYYLNESIDYQGLYETNR